MPSGIYKRTKIGYWTGKKRLNIGHWNIGKKHTEEWKRQTRERMRGRKLSEVTKQKIREARLKNPTITRYWKNKKFTKEHKKRLKEARAKLKLSGKNNPNWKNGEYSGESCRPYKHLHTKKYHDWRCRIFERDSWTCQSCKKIGGKLQAHHIKSWRHFEGLRFEVSNGITLCEGCHKLLHKLKFPQTTSWLLPKKEISLLSVILT